MILVEPILNLPNAPHRPVKVVIPNKNNKRRIRFPINNQVRRILCLVIIFRDCTGLVDEYHPSNEKRPCHVCETKYPMKTDLHHADRQQKQYSVTHEQSKNKNSKPNPGNRLRL